MPKILQKPLQCRNAHCGAMCCGFQIDMMYHLGGDPTKCPSYERRDDMYNHFELLDKLKEAKREIERNWYTKPCNPYEEGVKDESLRCANIIDKLIAESEEK